MPTRLKLKIIDNSELRKEIDERYEKMNQIDAAKWSLSIAKHILKVVNIDYEAVPEIKEGFRINELWQIKEARIIDIRQAGFKIHKLALDSELEINKTALRVVGQAVGSGHMKEHAMVASDYAVKTIGLMNSNSLESITLERKWQLNEIKKYL
ncbi:hypothetical protein BW727_101216 [Jeotgalibaca dankookensis]|uniref:Imm-5-like domain-containing protein n=1 Tax=Jeotgalibaca dankookensis TaxID=708126 RepID=A0A1S6IPV4_9LACT|nr:hypothetical protein [Jeotgalibaca dankookensis]AQS53583.1 hypothetical protein BW727_101216 [Jeotgalibaca dankookensis]